MLHGPQNATIRRIVPKTLACTMLVGWLMRVSRDKKKEALKISHKHRS